MSLTHGTPGEVHNPVGDTDSVPVQFSQTIAGGGGTDAKILDTRRHRVSFPGRSVGGPCSQSVKVDPPIPSARFPCETHTASELETDFKLERVWRQGRTKGASGCGGRGAPRGRQGVEAGAHQGGVRVWRQGRTKGASGCGGRGTDAAGDPGTEEERGGSSGGGVMAVDGEVVWGRARTRGGTR